MEPGNKMDATNLATLFAPNLLHTLADEPSAGAPASVGGVGGVGVGLGVGVGGVPQRVSSGFAPAAIIGALPAKQHQQQQQQHQQQQQQQQHHQPPERMEYVSAVRMLVDKRESIFEIPPEELHDVYLSFYEACPEMLDALLRRRCAMAGNE